MAPAVSPQRKVLAVSSSGGHWAELLRIAPAWEGCAVTYVTTNARLAGDLDRFGAPRPRFFAVPDASRWNKVQLVKLALSIVMILIRVRPHVIVSTGSAPGYFACRFGRMLGARTVWLESIANVDELSMSGRIVEPYADLWLTQWPHQTDEIEVNGRHPQYSGRVF